MPALPRPGARRLLPAASALALALAAGPALAQVTAQQIWDDWKAGLTAMPEADVTIGSESYEGGVLTVTDIALASSTEDGGTVAATLPELVLTENGDGTVTITMSPDYPIRIENPADAADGSGPTTLDLALRQQGLEVIASGTPGALSYDVAAQRVAVEFDRATEDGEEVPLEFVLALNGLGGTYGTTGTAGADRSVDTDLAAQSLDILLDVTDRDDGAHVVLSGKVDGLTSQASVVLPAAAVADPERALVNGLAAEGSYAYEGASYLFEMTDPETGAANGTVSTGAGSLDFALDAGAVSYDSAVEAVALQVASAALPFPVSAELAEYGVTFAMPLTRTEAPAPWALGLNLSGLTLNEEIWAMFDPGRMLPRDPATVLVGLSGTATLFVDLADPDQAGGMAEMAAPGQVDSVSIDELTIAFGGAEVTGTGAFAIDNADTTTFGGMPKPVGAAEFTLSGVNGLIDTLAAMGLIPEDQVMGARMMLGLLATPVGDDQLQSRIEVTQDGQVLANGQRLQ